MPYGDGTGPNGFGPMTGRGFGFCAGFNSPGFTRGMPRSGRGFGRGRGFGHGRGMGFGRRMGFSPFYEEPVYEPPLSKEDEKFYLEQEAKAIEQEQKLLNKELDEVKKKLKELK